jgi:hypothetical protein
MSDHLHIVCLDAPSPPDYGGAIDMYYKIVALAESGKKIILHYYDYNKKRNAELLKDHCIEINAYHRKNFINSFSQPHIISSRINSSLVKRLNKDDHPILLEGLHCTGVYSYLNNKDRVIVRMHNEEANYYRSLATLEKSLFKKIFFSIEASLLKKYQNRLTKSVKIACLSETDIEVLKTGYNFSDLHFIPCFIPWQTVNSQQGKGDYCLYHGNMAISENEAAASWLIENVFTKIDIPFVIAGNSISKKISAVAREQKNCKLVYNPPADELNSLIRDAHINILPSKNNTGVKLKLLHALFEGRFCISNNKGIAGSHIHSGVHVANEPQEYIQLIQELFTQHFTQQHITERKNIEAVYNNKINAEKLSALW